MGRRTKKVPFKSFDPEEEEDDEDMWIEEDDKEWDLDAIHEPTKQTQDVKIKQHSNKTRKD